MSAGVSPNPRPALQLLVRRLAKLGKGPLADQLIEAMRSALGKASRSLPANVRSAGAAPPERLLPFAGAFPKTAPAVERELAFTAMAFGPRLAKALGRVMNRLGLVNARITNAVGAGPVREWMQRYETAALRQLKRTARERLVQEVAGKAAERSVATNPAFVRVVSREVEEVGAIARNPALLEQLGLNSLDVEPLLFTDVRTAAVSRGPADARQLFVDLVVLFRGVGKDGSVKYLVKIRGQSKLDNVADLVAKVLEGGEFEIGQLAKDELRGSRGPWYFQRIRVPKDAIIQHPGLTQIVTIGTRDMTPQELEQLRFLYGISVEHLLHDVSQREFFKWARALVREIGITTK